MKNIYIKYNPYLLKTDITIDGKEPEANSSLHFGKQRLQEWAEKFLKIFMDEYRDANVTIEFTGSLDDYNDLKETIEANSDKIHVTKWAHNCIQNVEEVEKEVINLFNDIQNGPIEALKEQTVIDAFEKAMDVQFGINVIASMSTGKTTLINALLGKKLMPMAMKATTAVVTRIFASDQPHYSAVAKDGNGTIVSKEENINYETMKAWNSDERISSIDIYGPIPLAKKAGVCIVLVDTPCPNNFRDKHHRGMIYEMLEPSDNSLVLYVHSSVGGPDDGLIDYIGKCINNGNKKSCDRYIFAVTKMDTFYPENDEIPIILDYVKNDIGNRGITQPNLFPAASLPCLQLRDAEEYPDELDLFKYRLRRSDEFKLDSYYKFNHLPISSRIRLENSENEYTETEVHTGIPSIEEAIRLYVNKYARTMKVKDLVDSFNKRLISLKAMAEFEKYIRDNEEEKDRLLLELTTLEDLIRSGQSASNYSQLIDNVDFLSKIKSEVNALLNGFLISIDKLVHSYDNKTKISKGEAKWIAEIIEFEREEIKLQLHSRLCSIYYNCLKMTFKTIVNEYKAMYHNLGFGVSDNGFKYNPVDYIAQELLDIDTIFLNATSHEDENFKTYYSELFGLKPKNFVEYIRKECSNLDNILLDSTYCVDEGCVQHYKSREEVRVKRSIGDPLYWLGNIWTTVEREKTMSRWMPKYVEYVNVAEVVANYFAPIYECILDARYLIIKDIARQIERIKQVSKAEIKVVEKILAERLKAIRKYAISVEHIQEDIEQKEYELWWMNSISERVNNLINF